MKRNEPLPPDLPVVSIPDYQRLYAPWCRAQTYQLIASGDLKTVRIGARQYIKMESHRQLVEHGSRSSTTE